MFQIDKKPEFLSGREQHDVQHIEIVHEIDIETEKLKKFKSTPRKSSNTTSRQTAMTSSRSDSALIRRDRNGSKRVHFTRKNSLEELETDDFKTHQRKKYDQRRKKRGAKRGDSIEEEVTDLSLNLDSSQDDLSQTER